MDVNPQLLLFISIVSGAAACFTTGIAVTLWNLRGKAELVPLIAQRVDMIEKEVARVAKAGDQLVAFLARLNVGRTTFTED